MGTHDDETAAVGARDGRDARAPAFSLAVVRDDGLARLASARYERAAPVRDGTGGSVEPHAVLVLVEVVNEILVFGSYQANADVRRS